MAALKASCDEFEDAGGMGVLRERSLVLTGYLELALEASGLLGNVLGSGGGWKVLTPRDPSQRGAQLSLSYDHDYSLGPGRLSLRDIYKKLSREGVIVDIREVSDGAFFTERFFPLHAQQHFPARLANIRLTPQIHSISSPHFLLLLIINQPSVMRVAPAPLYNSAEDVLEFVRILCKVLQEEC